jgi:hypothetical protein
MSDTQDAPQLGRNPCMTNGRTTVNTYLVVAVRNDVKAYNAIGVRKLGHDKFKFHLWPNARVLGVGSYLEENFPGRTYNRDAGYSATGYVGIVLSRAETEQFLDFIKTKDNLTVAKRQHIMQVLDKEDEFGGAVVFNEKQNGIDLSEYDIDEDDE